MVVAANYLNIKCAAYVRASGHDGLVSCCLGNPKYADLPQHDNNNGNMKSLSSLTGSADRKHRQCLITSWREQTRESKSRSSEIIYGLATGLLAPSALPKSF